ncbi:winged helix-turn-helix domain-containing protein [Candidatus Pelagibacter sp.]|nr:winged helix-turn-helix domain-containing protein [Candidatus Pelagibacter sp.]
MSKQNIFIINYNSLYEIFEEIKDNLSFKIFKFNNEDEFIINCNLDIKNSLIISKSNKKLLLSKVLDTKNLFDVNYFPLKLNKLIELINIQLIKIKFNHQAKVNINGYELNLNSKFFSKNDLNLKLTEKEIEIILYLNQNKKKHDVLDLQKNIWGYSSSIETHTVETHIYRLRKKLKNYFSDDSFIISSEEGYFIE